MFFSNFIKNTSIILQNMLISNTPKCFKLEFMLKNKYAELQKDKTEFK